MRGDGGQRLIEVPRFGGLYRLGHGRCIHRLALRIPHQRRSHVGEIPQKLDRAALLGCRPVVQCRLVNLAGEVKEDANLLLKRRNELDFVRIMFLLSYQQETNYGWRFIDSNTLSSSTRERRVHRRVQRRSVPVQALVIGTDSYAVFQRIEIVILALVLVLTDDREANRGEERSILRCSKRS